MKKSTEGKISLSAYAINGKVFPVLRCLPLRESTSPLLNIRMMSDERERGLARKGPVV